MNVSRASLLRTLLPLALLLAAPSFAHAHVGLGLTHGFGHGAAHPLTGLDHLCAMVAVGLWASQRGGRALWAVPMAFVGCMALGGALGTFAVPVPFVERGILASVLVLGVLVAAAVRLPLAVSVGIVGSFALFHGYAHGAEMPETASGLSYALGFIVSTALLHLGGIALGQWLQRGHAGPRLVRYAGGAVAACGVFLCLAAPLRAADPAPPAADAPAFLTAYTQTGAALAADDLAGAKKAAAALADDPDAQALAGSADVKAAREAFARLSLKAEPLAKGQAGFVIFFCPMVNKDWVQPAGTKLANPYYGKAMLTCGVVKKA